MRDQVQQLHTLLREGAWVELVAIARAARAIPDVQTPHVEALLARAWVRLGQPDEAAEAAASARRASSSDDVILASAETQLAGGDPGLGRAELEAIGATGGQLRHECDLTLAMLLRATGEVEQAYAKATAVLARAHAQSEDPLRVEEALIVVGHTAWPTGAVDAARGAFERALLRRKGREAAPVLLAEALDGLGVCARHDNAPFEAVKLHEQALEQWVAGAGEDSGPVSACRHHLAQALHRTGDFLAARDEMARALLATGATLGKDHVDTWITRFELARYELDCGDPERGLPRMAQARSEVARRLGKDHPVVLAMDRFL